ncbi:hypothetical protein [Kitasatospora sp. NPDC057015]|uniref:hypothetical protein n=1 Tax=Kitasatospora sp. NPDC057015 TaxID=3346001 RepID=UPI003644D540
MPRIPPRTTDWLRAAAAAGGIASIVLGTYDSRWVPALGCLAVIALSVTEFALARVRRWIAGTETRAERQLALVTARQSDLGGRPPVAGGASAGAAVGRAGPWPVGGPARPGAGARGPVLRRAAPVAAGEDLSSPGLLRLLEAVHHELNLANEETARAKAELADLTREWNALVQESVCRQLGFCGPPGPERPSPTGGPRPPRPGREP